MELFEIQNPNVRDRLRYNVLPIEPERLAIQNSISTARMRLAEIRATDSPDHDVEAGALTQYMSEYSSLLAPIRLISVEILEIIFIQPAIHNFERMGPSLVTMYRPNAIGEVSYHWREVARRTSELWSSFRVSLNQTRYSDLTQIRLRLERSKNVPLSISFGLVSTFDYETPEGLRHIAVVKEIVAEFLPHAERWAHVALPPEHLFLFSSTEGRLRNLQTIAFLGGPHSSATESAIFKNAPKLRSLSVNHMRHPTDLPALPWHQLRQALIDSYDKWTVTAEVLALAPRLRSIIISSGPPLDERRHTPPPIPTPLPSPEVRKIVLLGNDARHHAVTKVLNAIDTPHLRELFLVKCAGWDAPSVPALVQRSGCFLNTLVLQEGRLRPTELLNLLSALTTLQTLVLIDNIPNTVTNIVIDGLTPLLPALSTLVLQGSHLFSTNTLLTMLENRMASQSPLVNIAITLPNREITPSDLERFAALRGVKSAYFSPVWFIFAGARRNWRYKHDSELQ
ncbi:hypothetical protein B0H19DRAFT_437243 [Mycena capillaripes]|nr:hypothetical protein B0H19DRAFT_437243 [Mycena capillaripes]